MHILVIVNSGVKNTVWKWMNRVGGPVVACCGVLDTAGRVEVVLFVPSGL